ncbi:hypothetical protein BJX96DRAFT_174016 [Aspergillus floccosus]
MRFPIAFLLFIIANVAGGSADQNPDLAGSLDQLRSQLRSLGDAIATAQSKPAQPESTGPSLLEKLPVPPASVVIQLLAGVPKSVYSDLMDPIARQELMKSFIDEDYPQWYHDLPAGAKNYFSELAASMTEAGIYDPTSLAAAGSAKATHHSRDEL